MFDIQRAADWCRNRFGPVNDTSVYSWAAHINPEQGSMDGIDMYFQNEEDATYFRLAFTPSTE